jgi:hypothetical protein
MAAYNTLKRRSGMFQQEEMSYESQGTVYGYVGDGRFEESSPYSKSGQKLIREASGQAPTAVQRLALALVSLGMLMGMSTLLTILATARSTPGWMAFSFLFVLTLFTAAVVSINIVFHRRAW